MVIYSASVWEKQEEMGFWFKEGPDSVIFRSHSMLMKAAAEKCLEVQGTSWEASVPSITIDQL